MSGRFQFSLKTLLGGMLLLCVALGLRYFHRTHFASYVVATTTTSGQSVRLQGQFFLPNAADSTVYWITIRGAKPGIGGFRMTSIEGRVERSGLGTYRFTTEPPCKWTLAGTYDLLLQPLDGEPIRGIAEISP